MDRKTIPGYGKFLLGKRLYDEGRFEEAHREFSRALEEDGTYERYWYYRGLCSFACAGYRDAEQDLLQAVRLFPDYACAWFLLGRTCQELREPDRAEDCFRIAEGLDPQFGRSLKPVPARSEV